MGLHIPSFMVGLLAVSGLFTIVQWFRSSQKNPGSVKRLSDDCFFFNPQKYSLKCWRTSRICDRLACPVCNFKRYINVIKGTKSNLDICMFFITSEAITDVILDLFKKGVFVRIIVDKQMTDETNNSKLLVFARNYVPVKIIDSGEIMHNKFLIIDGKKVLTGSFNWSKSAMQGNFENVILTHDREIVKKYENFFQDIWVSPIKRK